jgi:hypothetical protein
MKTMIDLSIDRATGFRLRRYILAYWLPVLIAFLIVIIINIFFLGAGPNQIMWTNLQCLLLSGGQCLLELRLDIIIYILLGITLFAYLLQIFTNQIVRFFEGYWDFFPLNRLALKLIEINKRKNNKINKQLIDAIDSQNIGIRNSLQQTIDNEYPNNDDLILPTKLGNVLRSAELHSYNCYGMDSVFWWSRLWQVLPKNMKNDINDALLPMIALLNFSILIPLFALSTFIYTFYQETGLYFDFWSTIFMGFAFLLISVILAWISYRAAIFQAIAYGSLVKTAVDLYRFKLLYTLHQSYPKNIEEESKIWDDLLKWVYAKDRISAPAYRTDERRLTEK